MKKLNSYFPIWFLVMMPPLLFLTISYNFVMVAIGLLIALFMIEEKNIFNVYSKNVLKLWGVTILLDIFTFIMLIIPEIFSESSYVYKEIIVPLETNPYSKMISCIYMIIIMLLNIVISYKLVSKILIKGYKADKKRSKLATIIMIIFMLPYLFFIPSSLIIKTEYTSLKDYTGTIMKNKSKVTAILTYLDSSKYINSYVIDTHAEPYTLVIYLKNIDNDYQKILEKDAATLFRTIDDINEISFHLNDQKYVYSINDINSIFKNVKKISLDDIGERYKDKKFEDYTYLGHINNYDVFDISEVCELEKQELFTYQNNIYSMNCTSTNKIMLYKDDEEIDIKRAIDTKKISIEDVIKSKIDLVKEPIENNEDID